MADWTPVPVASSWRHASVPPRTLVSRFGDGKELVRETESFVGSEYDETYHFTGAERETWHDFYELRRLLTSFTKLSYDDHDIPAEEFTVRFASAWSEQRVGEDLYVVDLRFRRVQT